MFKSKSYRNLIFYALVWILCEYAIAYLISTLIGNENSGLNALFLLATLYVFRLVNWIVNTIIGTIVYYLKKNNSLDDITATLHENSFPVVSGMHDMGAIEVLEKVIEDKNYTQQQKIFAALTLGGIDNLRQSGHVISFLRSQYLLDAAFAQYLKEKNSRKH